MGPHWTTLGPHWGNVGPHRGNIGATPGQHWGNIGATLDHIGATLGRRNFHCIDDSSFSFFCCIFEISSMDAQQNGYSHLLVATLGSHRGNIGVTLVPHWGHIGPPWGHIGATLDHIGATLGQHRGNIGATLGQHWTTLGPHWGAEISTALMIPVFRFFVAFLKFLLWTPNKMDTPTSWWQHWGPIGATLG